MSYYWDGTGTDNGGVAANTGASLLTSFPASVIAWIKPDAAATNKTVFLSRNSTNVLDYAELRVTTTGAISARSRNQGGTNVNSTTTSTISDWALVHGNWGGSSTTATDRIAGINGTEENFEGTDVLWSSTPNNMFIGDAPGSTLMFKGYIALVAVYNKVLSAAELTELTQQWPEDASSYGDCVAYWNFRSNVGTTTVVNTKNSGTGDLTLSAGAGTKPAYNSDNPTLAAATVKKLKLLAHASAISAANIEGVVLNAARDTVIGEFTGQSFDGTLVSGEAQLLITATDISPNGSTLTTSDKPLAIAYNATYTTPLVECTVVEV